MAHYKTALITGASSGIGEAFANQLAAEGSDLILVARSEDKLKAIAQRIHKDHGADVEVITADLGQRSPGAALATEVAKRGYQVDLLINNAGFGTFGSFHKQDAGREQGEIALNCAAVVDLAHAFIPGMLERNFGGIINVASVAAFQPLPFMTVYAATKAFVLSFTHGIRGEYRHKGINVTALCPGPVDTPFFEATGVDRLRSTVPKGVMLTSERVVSDCLKAFKAGKAVCVPGAASKMMAMAGHLTPRDLLAKVTAKGMKR